MVIGYGFRDEHINQTITRAVNEHGLKMFVVAPQGSDLARTLNRTRHPGLIQIEGGLDCATARLSRSVDADADGMAFWSGLTRLAIDR
jgi:hypothetical protein